ncbi:7TM diverse intracellular signaling domain-containing protein [Ramlibacter sp.]|uniref:7TM diverse intracellular signaling domain-containing protein n=1 Tax=Ramlibacter sp. TaxID=1917967 RepID=UPI003D14C4F9
MGILGGARHGLAAVLLLLAAALGGMAHARTVLELDPLRQPVPLLDWGDTWTDDSGNASPNFVGSDPDLPWQPTVRGRIYPLDTSRDLWIRFTVPPAPDAERWYVEVPYPAVNRVTLYSLDSVGQWLPQSAGDLVPVSAWPVPHRHPLLPLQVSAEEPRKYLLRVENSVNFSAPLMFVSEGYLLRREQRTSLILGMYFGLAALAAAIAFLGAVSLRDETYAWFGLAVVMMGLTQASLTGIAGLHLWPDNPWWNDVAVLVLPMLAVGALQGFVGSMVSLRERSMALHAMSVAVGLLAFIAVAAALLVEPSHRVRIMVPYIVLGLISGTLTVLWAARRGDRYAKWLIAGMVPVAVGAAFPLLRVTALLPVSFWTTYSMQIALAIELPILLLILMLRTQRSREVRRRVVTLERIDPATGLINDAVFVERLAQMSSRAMRLKYRAAVMVIDIVNIAQIRRAYDRRSAEELPLRVAGRLMSVAREIDSVARLADHRFGMLLEGPLTPQEIAESGSRVVARCLMPFDNKPLDWVAQVRVAQAIVPLDGADADDLMRRLEALLASVPADSKRGVFSLSKTA